MDPEKISAVLATIESEVPTGEARVSITHMVGGGSITEIKATRSGLLRLGIELIRAGTEKVPGNDSLRRLLLRWPDDDIFLDIKDRVEDLRPDPKKNRELSVATIWELVWTIFLFGFAAMGMTGLCYYFFR
jgi:hypothetical protein